MKRIFISIFLILFTLFLCDATEKINKTSYKISRECLQAKELLCPQKGGVRDRNKAINILRAAVKKGDPNAQSMLGRLLLDFCYNTYAPKLGRELLIAAKKQGVCDNSILLDLELYPPDTISRSITGFVYFYYPTSRYNNYTGIVISPNQKNSKLETFYRDDITILYDYSELRIMNDDELNALAEKGDYNALILHVWRNFLRIYCKSDKIYSPNKSYLETLNDVTAERVLTSEITKKFENLTKKLEIAHNAGYENASYILGVMYLVFPDLFDVKDVKKNNEYFQKSLMHLNAAAAQSVSYASFILLRENVLVALFYPISPISDEIVKNAIKEAENLAQMSDSGSGALSTLGAMYLWGIYVKKDEKKGLQYLEKSADNGEINAFYYLGKYYLGCELDGKQNEPIDAEKARYYKSMYNLLMD